VRWFVVIFIFTDHYVLSWGWVLPSRCFIPNLYIRRFIMNSHKSQQPTHNLDISLYTFEEILGLFNLGATFSEPELKEAKRKTQLMHPDKSRLPVDYFIFYCKAYKLIEDYYKSTRKMETDLTNTKLKYTPSMDSQFADMFPEHLSETQKKELMHDYFQRNYDAKTDPSKLAWFKSEETTFNMDQYKGRNINDTFKELKQKQKEMGLVKYQGVREYMSNIGGRSFFEDEDTEDTYATSDPFSKLKYDDVRKVHKDHLVMDIDENDVNERAYKSADHLANLRKMEEISHQNMNQSDFNDYWKTQDIRRTQENLLNYHKKDFNSQKRYIEFSKTMQYPGPGR